MQKKTLNNNDFSAIKLAWELGYTITIPLVILAVLGNLIDKKINTAPLFLIIGIILSIIISTIGVYRAVMPILEEKTPKKKFNPPKFPKI